jgi:hypothetical protein
MKSWIWIHIEVESWIRTRITVMWIRNSVADPDPGSGAFLTPGSGMNNLDHIS